MLVERVLDDYEQSFEKLGSKKQYYPKAKKMLSPFYGRNIDEVFTSENIRKYIFDTKESPENKRVAIQHFWNFIVAENIMKLGDFPIHNEETVVYRENSNYTKRKSEIEIIDYQIDIEELINPIHYLHLESEAAQITSRAVIALCLATGFDTKELFDQEELRLKFEDVQIISDSSVLVKHKSYDTTFEINEEFGRIIADYMNMRKDNKEEDFFIKTWKGRSLSVDFEVVEVKPSDIKGLVYYILQYICMKIGANKVTVTDLRANMVYRSLINTKGSSLVEIIKTYGYVPFVSSAFEKYCNDFLEGEDIILPFFNISSSESSDEDEETNKYLVNLKKHIRDRKIVESLKRKYDYKCQICDETLKIYGDINYIEAHHIIPLSEGGPDTIDNMIILCPNHHKLFDMYILAMNPENRSVVNSISGENHKLKVLHNINVASARFSNMKQTELITKLNNS